MISERAQRWWAGFFAAAGIMMSLAGLLFGVGLLVVPAALAAMPGDGVARWAWCGSAAAFAFSVATLAQVVLKRPILSTRALRTEAFNIRRTRRYQPVIALLVMSVVFLGALGLTVRQAVCAPGPREMGVAWESASLVFGVEAFMFAMLSFMLFHGWWKRRGGDLLPAPSRNCPECGYPLGGAMGGTLCPECGWKMGER